MRERKRERDQLNSKLFFYYFEFDKDRWLIRMREREVSKAMRRWVKIGSVMEETKTVDKFERRPKLHH